MYRRVWNYLRGQVTVEVESAAPERVLNLCAAHGIPFWELCWLSELRLRAVTTRTALPRLRQLLTGAGAQLTVLRTEGAPEVWRQYRRRYVLWGAAALLAVVLALGSTHIWAFEVTGNDTVPTETILRALEKHGVYFDVVDDDFLEECDIGGAALCSGFAEYRGLYIPNVKYISEKAAEAIKKFIAAGGRVYVMNGGMSFDGAPAYDESKISGALVGGGSENLRVMKRTADNAAVYVLYNESTERESFCVSFDETRKGFAANPENGKIFALGSKEYRFELEGGSAAVVIFTDEELSREKLAPPKLTPVMEVLSPKGEATAGLSVKNGVICTDDSGAPVCMKYSVEFESQGGKDIVIELDNPRYSAELVLNGEAAAQLIMPPFSCRIDSAKLKKNNVLDIYVKSVGGRAFVHSDISDLDEKRIGTYHEMTLPFERETDDIGLDGIKVYEV